MSEEMHLSIIADGAIASTQIGDGRLIPVLILECNEGNNFKRLVEIQESTKTGDAIVRWGYQLHSKRYVRLNVSFSKPMEIEINITFDLRKYAMVVDGIQIVKSVYLQPGQMGDRVSSTMDHPKIVIEIPEKTRLANWDLIVLSNIKRRLRKKISSRKSLKKAARDHLEKGREVFLKRMAVE